MTVIAAVVPVVTVVVAVVVAVGNDIISIGYIFFFFSFFAFLRVWGQKIKNALTKVEGNENVRNTVLEIERKTLQ